MRKKPNLEARMEKCAHLLVSDPKSYRGRWLGEFIRDGGYEFSEMHIELGCGKGLFTVESAKAGPDILHVALEKTTNVLIIALELANREGLQNVRFVNALADGLPEFFTPGEAARIYLNFSDPWPGNKRTKRRLTAPGFLEYYNQILKPGGEIHFKTDNLPFFEYSLREFERTSFVLSDVISDLHKNGQVGIMTDYELKFFSQGLPIYKCIALNA